jgi:dienelactone hydrolase
MSLLRSVDGGCRALLVLAAAFDAPVAGAAVRAGTAESSAEETVSGGAPATLYRPGGRGAWPALVLLNGATEEGRRHPRVVALARALARAGYLVLVPDVPGIARGEVTADGVRSSVECTLELLSRAEARPERAGLFGVSVGTTLALLAAAEEDLARRVSVVAGTTGYTDLADLIRLATTGTYRAPAGIRPYPAGPFLTLCVARSVCSGLDPGPSRAVLTAALEAVAADDPDPVAPLRRLHGAGLDEEARSALAVLVNRDPARFDELYAALPEATRAKVDRLSPVVWADRLQAPVELLFDPRDKYFPLEHARALERASPRVRVTTTEALAHADTRLSLRGAADSVRLLGFVTRALSATRSET